MGVRYHLRIVKGCGLCPPSPREKIDVFFYENDAMSVWRDFGTPSTYNNYFQFQRFGKNLRTWRHWLLLPWQRPCELTAFRCASDVVTCRRALNSRCFLVTSLSTVSPPGEWTLINVTNTTARCSHAFSSTHHCRRLDDQPVTCCWSRTQLFFSVQRVHAVLQ